MYKVLIVDDEEAVIKSLSASIDWEQLNLELAATAYSSEYALKIAKFQQIDIVITDIRMEGAGGLELCKQLKKSQPNIQIILISGHAEFSYAQRGFLYGVVGYCLKPLEYSEVTLYLNRAIQNLRDLQGDFSRDAFFEAIQTEDRQAIDLFLKQNGLISEQYYISVSIGEETIQIDLPHIRFLAAYAQHIYITTTEISLEQVSDFIQKKESNAFGSSRIPVESNEFFKKIQAVQVAAFQFFIDPAIRICYDPNDTRYQPYLDEVCTAIYCQSHSALIDAVKRIQKKNNMSMFTIKGAQKLYNTIFLNGFIQFTDDEFLDSFELMVRRYECFAGLLDYLLEALDKKIDINELAPRISNTNLLKMMLYVNAHYNEDISIAKIAEMVHMNPNYLSQVFKKEYGETFTKYVTNLRIEKAKELLVSTDFSLVEIAAKVGFNDYFYFIKVFKKTVGKTPNQFKRNE